MYSIIQSKLFKVPSSKKEKFLLCIIFLIFLVFRLYLTTANLPYTYKHDENNYIETAMRFGTGDFKPNTFLHGGLYQLILFAEYAVYYLVSKFLGFVHTPLDFFIIYLRDPTIFFILARVTVALCGTGIVYLSYLIAARIYNKRAAFVTGLFSGFSLILLQMSSLALADIPMIFILLLSFLILVYSVENPLDNKRYYIACLLVGLAAACKYNAVFGVATLYIAAFFKCRTLDDKYKKMSLLIVSGSFFVLIGFFIGMPHIITNFTGFYNELIRVTVGNRHLWENMHENTWLFYFTNHLRNGLGIPLELIVLSGIVYALYKHSQWDILILSFPITQYLVFMRSIGFAYHLLPTIPFILILAGRFLNEVTERLFLRFSTLILICLSALIVYPTVLDSIKFVKIISSTDTRTQAKAWIEANIPEGTTILSEGYVATIAIQGPPIIGNIQTLNRDLEYILSLGGSGLPIKTKIANFDAFYGMNKSYNIFKKDLPDFGLKIDPLYELFKINPAYIIMTGFNDYIVSEELNYLVPKDYATKRRQVRDIVSAKYALIKSFSPSDNFTSFFPHLTDGDYVLMRSITLNGLKNYIIGPKIDIYKTK